MRRLVRAEFRKIATTKLWWGMLLASMVFAALAVIAQLAGNGVTGNPAASLTSARGQQAVLSAATFGDIFTLVVGIIAVTSEYRHLTCRPTFVFEPRRGRIVTAKLAAYTCLGMLYAAAAVLMVFAIALPWLAGQHVRINWIRYHLLWVIGGDLATITAFTLIGIGIGVLVRNQTAAIITALAYVLVLGPLTQLIPGVRALYRWLPTAAADAVTNTDHSNHKLLPPGIGLTIFLAWALAFTTAGWWITQRRDLP